MGKGWSRLCGKVQPKGGSRKAKDPMKQSIKIRILRLRVVYATALVIVVFLQYRQTLYLRFVHPFTRGAISSADGQSGDTESCKVLRHGIASGVHIAGLDLEFSPEIVVLEPVDRCMMESFPDRQRTWGFHKALVSANTYLFRKSSYLSPYAHRP
jgi:hypothetical protein